MLSIAEEEVFSPLWSGDILTELREVAQRQGVSTTRIDYRINQMNKHFPGALVERYEDLIPSMSNDPGDRHVLAAAIRGNAETIVTENRKDFPNAALASYDMSIVHQDDFLLDQYELTPHAVHRALARQVSRYRRTPRSIEDLLIALGNSGNGCPQFAATCHKYAFGR